MYCFPPWEDADPVHPVSGWNERPSLPPSPTSVVPAAGMRCQLCPPRLSWASLWVGGLLHFTSTVRPGSRKGAWGISSQHEKSHCSLALSYKSSVLCPQNTGREWKMTSDSGDLIPFSKHMPSGDVPSLVASRSPLPETWMSGEVAKRFIHR